MCCVPVLLAGEVFVIRYGVRAPVASLGEKPRLQLRQALIRTESPPPGERKRSETMYARRAHLRSVKEAL